MSDPRIIVALDFDNADEALKLAGNLRPDLCRLKIGKQLFTKAGPDLVSQLVDENFGIFLDLKFHDIPATVAKACAAAADLGVWMVSIHAGGGGRMMRLAREATENRPNRPMIIGVTVLTSFADGDLEELGLPASIEEQVLRLSKLSYDAGLDGVVCSAHEAERLRNHLGQGFKLITPGIRPVNSDDNDQRRIMTPVQAIQAGSDYLVIGRPITQAAVPILALESIQQEINTSVINT